VAEYAMTTLVTAAAPIRRMIPTVGRAKCLQRLVRLESAGAGAPWPLALWCRADIGAGAVPDLQRRRLKFPRQDALLCVRPSSQDPDWGGPGAVT